MNINELLVPTVLYAYLIKQVYSYTGVGYTRLYRGAYSYSQLANSNYITLFLTLTVFFATLLISFGMMRKHCANTAVTLSSFVLIVGTVIWMFITVRDVGFVELIYTSTPPYVYLTALALYIGMDRDVFASFIKHAPIIGCISIILGLV